MKSRSIYTYLLVKYYQYDNFDNSNVCNQKLLYTAAYLWLKLKQPYLTLTSFKSSENIAFHRRSFVEMMPYHDNTFNFLNSDLALSEKCLCLFSYYNKILLRKFCHYDKLDNRENTTNDWLGRFK